jgi:hypothetical protein
MTAKVIPFPSDVDIREALRCLERAGIVDFLICGYDKDGMEFFASPPGVGGADALWMLERARYKLMRIAEDVVVCTDDDSAG